MLNICKPVPINMIRLLSAFIKIVHRCRSSILSDPTGRVSINAINPNRTQQRHQTPHASNNYIIHINKNIILYTRACELDKAAAHCNRAMERHTARRSKNTICQAHARRFECLGGARRSSAVSGES